METKELEVHSVWQYWAFDKGQSGFAIPWSLQTSIGDLCRRDALNPLWDTVLGAGITGWNFTIQLPFFLPRLLLWNTYSILKGHNYSCCLHIFLFPASGSHTDLNTFLWHCPFSSPFWKSLPLQSLLPLDQRTVQLFLHPAAFQPFPFNTSLALSSLCLLSPC